MIAFAGRAVLLDIEGTTSSVRYVYDVLFPYAREHLADFLARRGQEPAVVAVCEQLARDAEASSLEEFVGGDTHDELARERIVAEAHRLMDSDAKTTGLKALQGLIWEEGYAAGGLRSHVYDDVPPALRAWHEQGRVLAIYSSGSVTAQKVFFAHTESGDLTPLFRAHYDTTVGPKRDAGSYARIVADLGVPASDVLFLSDVPAELDAAKAAGLATGLVVRPGNAPVSEPITHAVIHTFAEIEMG